MNVIFLGGIHTDSLAQYIQNKSIGPIQNAADILQKNYVYGLANTTSVSHIDIINLPYVGSYPNYFKDRDFQVSINHEVLYGNCNVYNKSFNNIRGLKNISRLVSSLKSLLHLQKKSEEYRIVCYSMHLPFLIACYLTRLLRRKSKYYVIIPDLPEYMSARSGLASFVHKIINKASYYIVNRSDGVALITSHMAQRFKPGLKHVVIEGISSPVERVENVHSEWWPDFLVRKEYFLYTGTLDQRYGIRDLVDSYISAGINDKILVICGDGDDRSYVEAMSLSHANIRYMGQLKHTNIKILQRNAALLINPRNNEGEFTKYSFPSKVIEYMSSGVPVLMYQLDGIPESYNKYFYSIESKNDFMHKLNEISVMSSSELKLMGDKAKEFITEHTGPIKQAGKLLTLFK